MEEKKEVDVNEEQRKGISRFRLSILFIILGIIFLGYCIYEIIAYFTIK